MKVAISIIIIAILVAMILLRFGYLLKNFVQELRGAHRRR